MPLPFFISRLKHHECWKNKSSSTDPGEKLPPKLIKSTRQIDRSILQQEHSFSQSFIKLSSSGHRNSSPSIGRLLYRSIVASYVALQPADLARWGGGWVPEHIWSLVPTIGDAWAKLFLSLTYTVPRPEPSPYWFQQHIPDITSLVLFCIACRHFAARDCGCNGLCSCCSDLTLLMFLCECEIWVCKWLKSRVQYKLCLEF